MNMQRAENKNKIIEKEKNWTCLDHRTWHSNIWKNL